MSDREQDIQDRHRDAFMTIHDEYQRRLGIAQAAIGAQDQVHRRLADVRLGLFIAGLIIAGLAYFWDISWWWLVVPAIAFGVSVVAQERAARRKRRAKRAAVYYEKGLARLEDRWAGQGETGSRYLDLEHPYAGDLDLFGVGSLFDRLCVARTQAGEATLAAWLLAPAGRDEILARQEAVAELAPRLDFREDLALLGGDVRGGMDATSLLEWAANPPQLVSQVLRRIAQVLAVAGLGSLLGWIAVGTGPVPFIVVVVIEVLFWSVLRKKVKHALAHLDQRTDDLLLLGEMLARIEREPFQSRRLESVKARLLSEGGAPSRSVAVLADLAQRLEYQKNAFIAPLLALVLWSTRLAFEVESWRNRFGKVVPDWLAAIGEIEAIASLATYAGENPQDPFPEILTGEPRFDAKALGHPLLARRECVANDVSLGMEPRVLVVSGSNMSGKSTLMRTVGVNAVLALAGAPVRAGSLQLTPVAIGATLRVQDSLQAGRSRFYAEILRVRLLVDIASKQQPPLLFLLDEIFHGTNSRDRAMGAEGVLNGLIARGAIGFVSTHDLALAVVAERLAPVVKNVHFEDQMVDGRMAFDYRMRPGVVQSSNALALMRAVGLEV
jgi:MutS domain V